MSEHHAFHLVALLEDFAHRAGLALVCSALHDGIFQVGVKLFARAVNHGHAALFHDFHQLAVHHADALMQRRILALGGKRALKIINHRQNGFDKGAGAVFKGFGAHGIVAAAEVFKVRLHTLRHGEILFALRLRFFKSRTQPVISCACDEAPIPEVVAEEQLPEQVILVNGMMCSHCTAAVEKACMAVPGTVNAVADLERKQVTVTGTASYEDLKQAIQAEDYEVVEPVSPQTLVIRVNGMMCSHCTAAVEKACLGVPGTETAVADLASKTVTVTGTADYAALKQAIIAEDYEVVEE